MAQMRIGDLLISAGTITEEELNRGLELQKGTGKRLGTVLIDNGIITEKQLIEALQMQLGIDYVDLSKVRIPMELAQTVPKNIAKQFQVVPYKEVKGDLYLAMSDPLNFYAIEEVRKAVHKKVIPVVSTASAISHAIMVLYGNEGAAKAIEDMKREVGNEHEDTTDNAFISNKIDEEAAASAPTIRLVNSIIERAVLERASDIHLEPRENEMQVRMRIDGVMRNVLTVPGNLQQSVISRIKIMSGMDIAERRVPQDGRFNVQIKNKDIDMRVSSLPTVYGEKIVTRLLDKSGTMLSKEAIGLTGSDLEKFDKLIHCHNGVVLIVGPTGSGKSSTMYTMINELNTEEVNLVTLEDPVEYNIDGINQVQINEKQGLTFAAGLRSILRQDPDIIAVGEIRDGETADIAMRAAITGHVVLSTIHTNDSARTVDRLVDIGVEPYLIAGALKGVISQRLVRRICPHCKTEYTATADELRRLGMDPSAHEIFSKGEGCSECFNTGYQGRIAVFEIMMITPKIRQMIQEGKTGELLIEELTKGGSDYVSLHDNGIRLLREGVTSVDEVLRVINEAD
ncbi:MAG: Flp pilus assembly complex ATPase component TadA [Parasporobacterium sp.]|nr:Flp pilus assembly complex ATPase component TadA [Parasporobacterium sp.]